LFFLACQQDPAKLIIGEWEIQKATVANLDQYMQKFKEQFRVSESEIQSEKSRIEKLPEFYYPQGITMEFRDSSKFFMGGTEGRWQYFPDKSQIEVHFGAIDTARFLIEKINKNELVLLYDTEFSSIPLEIRIQLKRIQ
jgi:hypothetical protein